MDERLCTCNVRCAWGYRCTRHDTIHTNYFNSAASIEPPAPTLDDIRAGVAKLDALEPLGPEVAGYLVAPDVWDKLAASIPVVRGSSFSMGGLWVKRVPELEPGAWFPVDRDGTPLPKPKKGTL